MTASTTAVAARTRRILVFGSAVWPWPEVVAEVLDRERSRLGDDDVLVVRYGTALSGADAAVAAWSVRVAATTGARLVVEQRADAAYSELAGSHADAAARAVRPDLAIAFWADHSLNTGRLLFLAAQARIPAVVHTAYSTGTRKARPAGALRGTQDRVTRRPRTAVRTRKPSRDELAEQQINQGYTADVNPVCPTCHEQTSRTGQCFTCS